MESHAIAVSSVASVALDQFGELSIDALVIRRQKTVEALDRVMTEGVHYGVIPGTGNKPSLYKAGAEVLAMTFGLAPVFQIRRADLAGGHREYEITCQLRHVPTGALLGEGVGSCSTMESKYRWRRGERKCPTCNAPAIMRSKFVDKETNAAGWYCYDKRGGCGAQFPHNAPAIVEQVSGRVENPDIADTYNTVLKMAKKRAQVDATLTAVGASDLLTQDLEDLHDAGDDHAAPRQADEKPASKAKPAKAEEPPRVDPNADKIADQIIIALDEATTADDLKPLAAEINRLPKKTTARHRAYDAYLAVLKKLTAAETQH
jgi:hypothetical protein